MVEKSEEHELAHQDLRLEKSTLSKPGRAYKNQYEVRTKNRKEFVQKIRRDLDSVNTVFEEAKATLQKNFDANMFLQITTQGDKYKENTFSTDLAKVDIDVVSSADIENGRWVAYARDHGFKKLRDSLGEYARAYSGSKQVSAMFLDFVHGICPMRPERKMSTEVDSLPADKRFYVDVELYRVPNVHRDAYEAEKILRRMEGIRVTDSFDSYNLSLVRVMAGKPALGRLAAQGYVKRIRPIPQQPSAPHKPALSAESAQVVVAPPPGADAPSVLLIDSGVVEHPLLKNSLKRVTAVATKLTSRVTTEKRFDDVGHGTSMAGIVLYGDIEKCKISEFVPRTWLNSVKIMHRCKGDPTDACFDLRELLEHQLETAVSMIKREDPNCRVINISFGNVDASAFRMSEQHPIARLVDELFQKYEDTIFVVAAGNNTHLNLNDYPRHLLDGNERVRIIDPATSVHAITVGAVKHNAGGSESGVAYPSSITRVGPGFKGTIKPELVDFGGDVKQPITVLRRDYLKKGPFVDDWGTSISAALTSHHLAILVARFPDSTRNLIKALLIASAKIPDMRPIGVPPSAERSKNEAWTKILPVYGYGQPRINHALYSENSRVVLKNDSSIGIDMTDYYRVYLPDAFYKTRGLKRISVALAYDPPVKAHKSSYLGLSITYKMFKDMPVGKSEHEHSDSAEPSPTKNVPIAMQPGFRLRGKSTHQKSSVTYRGQIGLTSKTPLVLAVSCKSIWFDKPDHKQPYAVAMTVEHEAGMDLYNPIMEINRLRRGVRLRSRDK